LLIINAHHHIVDYLHENGTTNRIVPQTVYTDHSLICLRQGGNKTSLGLRYGC